MNIEYLIQLLENKLVALNNAKNQMFNTGEIESINNVDTDILSTEDTLNKLRLILTFTTTANAANASLSEVITNGIEVIKNTPIVLDDATKCMSEYDISSYATDPLHEQKIADILEYMGAMNSPADVDSYISNEAIASPITGQMVWGASQQYTVDIRLMLALMELDSRFGTVGIAIKTLNPGNIGNNDSGDLRTYSSWEEGVRAVAEWLKNHRTNTIIEPTPAIEPEETPDNTSQPDTTNTESPAIDEPTTPAVDATDSTTTDTNTETTTDETTTPVSYIRGKRRLIS